MVSKLGIDEKSDFIKKLLGDLAYADCYHDFGNLKFNDTKIFKDLSIIIKKNNDKEIILKDITDYINDNIVKSSEIKTVYDYFEKTGLLTPATSIVDKKYLNENKILNTIFGNNVFDNIKTNLKDNEKKYFDGEVSLPKDINIDINIGEEIKRIYKYSVYPTKRNGIYYNIPYSYREVSNNNNFIILIDASFFHFSSLRDEDILLKITNGIGAQDLSSNDINRSYTFYIIKNNENLADPATKISFFNKGNQRIKIKILKDKISTNIEFLAYSNEPIKQNNNLFSSINLNTINSKEDNEEIDAKVNYPNKAIHNYENISLISSINTATLNALIESYKLKYNPLKEKNGEEDNKLKTLIYILLKRSGDWCQALSLLDRKRIYEVYDYDTDKKEGETTLDDLKKKEKADIALVTHDRILLAYSILLGLNVFFSLKTDENKNDTKSTVWNIYFKNTYDTIEVDKSIYNKLSSVKSLSKFIGNIEKYIDKANKIFRNVIKNLKSMSLKDLPDNIVYNPTLGTVYYKTVFINPLKGELPLRKEYLQENPKSHIEFFQELILKLRKQLTIVANLTSSATIFEESKKVKEIFDQIKSDDSKNELYKELNETYSNIEELHIINTKLENIYTEEDEENDKIIIKDYFTYINNSEKNLSEIKKLAIEKYNTLLIKIHNNYIISENIINSYENSNENNKMFLNTIPFIDELIYNNILIEKSSKQSICKFLKEVRNQVTPKDMIQDNVENLSKICEGIEMSKKPEGTTFLEDNHKLAKEIAKELKKEGKKFNEVDTDPINYQEEETQPLINSNSNSDSNANSNANNSNSNSDNTNPPSKNSAAKMSVEPLNSNSASPPSEMNVEAVESNSSANPLPKNSSPKIVVEPLNSNSEKSGGYKIEYIYDGKGNFYSTISEEEKDPTKKSILLYLDSLFSRLFSLKQYPNGGDDKDYPSFDDNVYEQYLIIFKELKSIDLFLKTNDIKELNDTYNKKRYQWRGEDLKPYMKELEGGLDDVDNKVNNYCNDLYNKVSPEPIVNARPVIEVNLPVLEVNLPVATPRKNIPITLKRKRNNSQHLNSLPSKYNRKTRVKKEKEEKARRQTRNRRQTFYSELKAQRNKTRAQSRGHTRVI